MNENTGKPTYEKLPLNPEQNPPETIEEIEILIDKLHGKAVSIKQQLEVVAIREREGLTIDYDRVRRAVYAKAQTNRSIAALQRIVKNKRQQEAAKAGHSFEKFFFEAAKEELSSELLTTVLERAFIKIRSLEYAHALKAETAPVRLAAEV